MICLEEWKTPQNSTTSQVTELVSRLVPCGHLECNTCFVSYHQNINKLHCPLCQAVITHTSIINSECLTEATVINPFTTSSKAFVAPYEDMFNSFDH